MKDISYHMLDIVRNSISAGADRIEICMDCSESKGTLVFAVKDNGKGMTAEVSQKVTDPFFTSSVTKKVGLGIPLLKQNAEQTGGSLILESEADHGTRVSATFMTRNIDMIPLGDIPATIRNLIATCPDADFLLRCCKDSEGFELDTAEVKKELETEDLGRKEILDYLTDYVREGLKELNFK